MTSFVASCDARPKLTIDAYCELTKPHEFSDATLAVMDRAELEQETEHNETWEQNCGQE